ncbi:hypothetical protein OAC67_04070, partial [Planktomarina temperata]|nr:hypothetical protein [Planktomarina temperata]
DKRLTYSIHVERAFNGLVELGYLSITTEGFHDRKGRKDGTPTSRLTRYVSTDQLLSLFTDQELSVLPVIVPQYNDPELLKIRVKEVDATGVKRKRSITISETAETERMRSNLERINKALSRHWCDLEIQDDTLTDLQRRLAGDPAGERTIRMDQRSLYRVFNDPELQTGGRFYGGWWQNIPKEARKHLVVNGKKMVELDYSNQHPSILYAKEGIARPDDCYSDVINPYSLPKAVNRKQLRKAVKTAFNAMLNSQKPLKRPPKGLKLQPLGLTWAELSSAIITFHEPIAHYFYTGLGLQLQRLDSDIAEKVLLHFADKGIAILPLHDSFIMHHGYRDWLEPVMHDAYLEVVGQSSQVDLKVWHDPVTTFDDSLGQPTNLSIVEILADQQGHADRLDAFRTLQKGSRIRKAS